MENCSGAVDRSGYLRVCASKIANKLVVGDRYLDANRKWAITNAIIINPIRSLIGTFGEFRQLKAGPMPTVIEQSFNKSQKSRQSILARRYMKAAAHQSERDACQVRRHH